MDKQASCLSIKLLEQKTLDSYLPKIPLTACSKSEGSTTVLELSDSENSKTVVLPSDLLQAVRGILGK